MRILVTGATGFIGKALVPKLLEAGHEVVCVVRRPVDDGWLNGDVGVIQADIEETDRIKEGMGQIDVAIHLAAQLGHFGIPYEVYHNVNYLATMNLARACAEQGVEQFVFCSTPAVVGMGGRLTDENEPYHPNSEYAETKMLAEQGLMKEFAPGNEGGG